MVLQFTLPRLVPSRIVLQFTLPRLVPSRMVWRFTLPRLVPSRMVWRFTLPRLVPSRIEINCMMFIFQIDEKRCCCISATILLRRSDKQPDRVEISPETAIRCIHTGRSILPYTLYSLIRVTCTWMAVIGYFLIHMTHDIEKLFPVAYYCRIPRYMRLQYVMTWCLISRDFIVYSQPKFLLLFFSIDSLFASLLNTWSCTCKCEIRNNYS